MKITIDNLNSVTIKSYLKHFNLKVKNGFIYKKDIAIYIDDLNNEQSVLSFLMGISAVVDNPNLWENKPNYEKGFNLLIDYFDSIDEEEQKKVHKELLVLGL